MSATSLPISRVHAPGGGWRDELAAIGVVWHRELLRFTRNRLRMVTSLVQPLLFLFILGSGLSNMLPSSGNVNFKTFMFPGIIAMTVFFTALSSPLSIVWTASSGSCARCSSHWFIAARSSSASAPAVPRSPRSRGS
jgi:ABC-2 type transport system permease protein